ncbi:MAG: acylphosphatase [Thalassovita sp.]
MRDIAVKSKVTGRVQGVAYRAWAQSRAAQLGLCGWVCNEISGSVSVLVDGDRDAVAEFLSDLWEGPGAASVLDVQSRPEVHNSALTGFTILQ